MKFIACFIILVIVGIMIFWSLEPITWENALLKNTIEELLEDKQSLRSTIKARNRTIHVLNYNFSAHRYRTDKELTALGKWNIIDTIGVVNEEH
jgi:lipopolysaccharide export LptBFGC system permease protein LptF